MTRAGTHRLFRRVFVHGSRGAITLGAVLLLAHPASAATVNIAVINNAYNPRTPTINEGDTVVWNWNSGGSPHSVRSGSCPGGNCTHDGLFDSTIKTGGSFSHTFNSVGSFPYFCAVHQSSMTGTITVQPSNPLTCNPMADIPVGNPPLTVQFMANPGGGTSPYTFSWDFDDGTASDTSQDPQHTFNALGTYDVTLTVTDNVAAQHPCMTQIIVTDLTCSATADPNTGDFPLDVTLTATASGGDPNYMFMWDLGDGSPMPMGEVVMHTYATPGTKHVMLMATDALMVPCAAPIIVQVTDPNCPAGDDDVDQVCDSVDNCPADYNPSQADADADTVGDACDNCPASSNAGQGDTDMDGSGDACDLTIIAPMDGASFSCGTVPLVPPTITWIPDVFNRFKVSISWDPGFTKGTGVTSGTDFLRTTFWTPSVRKWRKACTNALGSGGTLFIRIFGKVKGTTSADTSEAVSVDVLP